VDPQGYVTEGSFTSLFVKKGAMLLTPKLSRGLLPGILRELLIEEGRAAESELRLEDLSGTFYIGNAVRGLIAASLLERR
jgi:branched-subunit amino acid aminotransferase/4-amino-4-deoxychorismate lyase